MLGFVPTSPMYPMDLAAELHRREVAAAQAAAAALSGLGSPELDQRPDLPDESFLRETLEAIFFASLLDEEGDAAPIAVVLAPDGPESLTQLKPPWQCFTWSPEPLSAKTLRKRAMTASPGKSYLVISRFADESSLCGVALPPPGNNSFFSDDKALRVCAMSPGALVIDRGSLELLRYSGGAIAATCASPFDQWGANPDAVALRALRASVDAVGGSNAATFELLINKLVREVARTAKGGMLAYATDPSDDLSGLLSSGRRLDVPLKIGQAFVDCMEAIDWSSQVEAERMELDGEMGPPTEDTENADLAVRRTSETLDRLIAQTGRMSAVDGAVVILPGFDVGAFGCKIPIDDDPPSVLRVSGWPEAHKHDGGLQGTRHRAAVSFAAKHEGRFAICVSQDGPVSAFFSVEGQLYCWPMPTPAPWRRD